MTGEVGHFGSRAGRQPGGRAAAPGALALVQAFINTHYDLDENHGAEVLHSPAALAAWLHQADLIDALAPIGEPDLRRALRVRESLRTLAGAGAGAGPGQAATMAAARRRLDEDATGTRVVVRFTPEGPRFPGAPEAGVDGAIGALLAIVAQAIAGGTWSRLKICPGRECGWAFYDHSRNRSGRWCSMSVCGGRAKARSHYRRQRAREL